jgi:DNA-binding response OmpR family regulator
MHFPTSTKQTAPAAATKSVLWVEDDDAYRFALGRHLTAAGYEVIDAPDYRKALEVLDSDRSIGLLLADIRLPKDTPHGFSIARMARVKRPKLPILFVTGYDVPSDETGVPGAKILSKNLSMDVLLLEVQTALDASTTST